MGKYTEDKALNFQRPQQNKLLESITFCSFFSVKVNGECIVSDNCKQDVVFLLIHLNSIRDHF